MLLKDPTIRFCSVICFAAFGGFAAWAGLVKLDEGVAASGSIVVEDNRRVIQHLEGGIIESIAVHEGNLVGQGDTLLVLRNIAGEAARSELLYDLVRLEASNIRRDAQSVSSDILDFSALDPRTLLESDLETIRSQERDLFEQETGAFSIEVSSLQARSKRAKASASPITAQQNAMKDAAIALQDQLKRKRALADMQLVRLDEVRELERNLASTLSEIARFQNEKDKANADSIDFNNQIAQVRATYRTRLSEERLEAKRQIQVIQERLVAAQDLVDRTIITAPSAGEILNLNATTIGGVVKPGDPILEIVPLSKTIIASVKVNPRDRASVSEGLKVRARISAFDNRDMPELVGEIISLSGDLKTDPATQGKYFEARVQIADLKDGHDGPAILPGLPVDVFIFSGAERTTLEHLFDPLAESMFAGLRGQ